MGEGSKEKGFEVRGGAPESPLSMGPERPRYATEQNMVHTHTAYGIILILLYVDHDEQTG